MSRTGTVLAILYGYDGTKLAEIFKSHKLIRQRFYYRILGGNGKGLVTSEAYGTGSDAIRGAVDLMTRLQQEAFDADQAHWSWV